MQHSVDTVDPNVLDLRQFPQLSTCEGATVQDEPLGLGYQWADNGSNGVKNYQNSDDQLDNQLGILGHFDFKYETLE